MSDRMWTAGCAGLLLAGFVLSGCVVRPVGPRVYVGATIGLAPPPLRYEVIGVAPGPGYIWTGGYWGWAGGRYQWNHGRWVPRRAGYFWVRPHWVRARGGWRFARGHWRPR